MEEAGAEVETFHVKRLKIKPCTGELHCWYEKPGQCYQRDDMEELYSRLQRADILVLAVPVYIPLPGEMQNLINRLCPLLDPLLEVQDGRTRARMRQSVNIKKIVLVSAGGWWELENFNTLVAIMEELAANMRVEFTDAILRPHAFLMIRDGEITPEGQSVLEAVHQAGRQLAEKGSISKELSKSISRPLISFPEYIEMWNRNYETVEDRTAD
jgi:multimeric flavodoxin WrbA